MKVNIRLLGWLREYLRSDLERFEERDMDLAPGTTVGSLAAELGFRDELDFLAMRNGERVPPERLDDTTLQDGDAIVYVPPLKGG
jgi:sulfur carrier protein ThiS